MIGSGSGSRKSDYATLEDEGRITKIEKTLTASAVAFEAAMYLEAPVQKLSRKMTLLVRGVNYNEHVDEHTRRWLRHRCLRSMWTLDVCLFSNKPW